MLTSTYVHTYIRGYESWLGYWHHSNDYWQHTADACGVKPIRDLWEYNSTFDGPSPFKNGPDCSQKHQNPLNQSCVYEEELFTNEVLRIINEHDGEIEVGSFTGRGAEFVLTLPKEPA